MTSVLPVVLVFAKPLQLVVKPVLDACGDQRRPLLVDSLLAGTGTEMYALVAADSQSARNCLDTERDPAATRLMVQQVGPPEQHYSLLEEFTRCTLE